MHGGDRGRRWRRHGVSFERAGPGEDDHQRADQHRIVRGSVALEFRRRRLDGHVFRMRPDSASQGLARGQLAMSTALSSPHLVGREIETERLVDALDAAQESHPTLTLVIGEAGVGKTRLAREAAKQAADRGMLVLRGECVELSGGEFPYAPVAAALRDLEPRDLDEALTKLPRTGLAGAGAGLSRHRRGAAGSGAERGRAFPRHGCSRGCFRSCGQLSDGSRSCWLWKTCS